MMTVTALHSSTFLILRSLPGAGALRTDPLIPRMRERLVDGRMITTGGSAEEIV